MGTVCSLMTSHRRHHRTISKRKSRISSTAAIFHHLPLIQVIMTSQTKYFPFLILVKIIPHFMTNSFHNSLEKTGVVKKNRKKSSTNFYFFLLFLLFISTLINYDVIFPGGGLVYESGVLCNLIHV